MGIPFRETAKHYVAATASFIPQARYEKTILILSHMRAATTALSNVICSHPAVSGYGETHVAHITGRSPGQLVVNLALRAAYSPTAPFLLDKVLHNRLDRPPPVEFFQARAIFMVRSPGPAIRSICKLANTTDMQHLQDPVSAAFYYATRLEALADRWTYFPPENRFGITAEDLLADPDGQVGQIGAWLKITPELENRYVSHKATQIGGGGDPMRSASHTRIVGRLTADDPAFPEEIDAELKDRCLNAYRTLKACFET